MKRIRKLSLVLILLLLILELNCAPTTKIEENLELTTPLPEIVQLQTIKKILSSNLDSQINKKPNNCEDIEKGIKETIHKSNQNDRFFAEFNKKAEEPIIKDKLIPSGRNLFGRSDDLTTTPPSEFSSNYNQNIIMVPCLKQLNESEKPEKQTNRLIHSIDTSQSYILERVFSPSGNLLYYMYRLKNNNPEQMTIETTTTTNSPIVEPFYSEQMRFVVQMPYVEPEEVKNKENFDQYAYYPREFQPNFVQGPVPYQPTFHIIKALVIPNEYLNDQNNQQNTK